MLSGPDIALVFADDYMAPHVTNTESRMPNTKKKPNGTLKDFVLSSMTFGVLLIFIISPNNCCR